MITLRGVRKEFGQLVAVEDLDLDVRPGEFLTLLGPSGCGKTTTLNMIAGFLAPDRGSIVLDGQDVSGLPPDRRDTAMVFQQYALFPHLTVGQNVAYGLRMRKRPKAEVRTRVADALERVGLAGREERMPSQLSGGQQQRVALARAIVVRPKVLLFDEPLSNLDLKLREQLRLEIKHLQRELGVTSVFVTHDQTEALVMSDRIAVMRDGHVEQLDTPERIYRAPANAFVAGFVGQSNLVDGVCVAATPDECTVRLSTSDVVTARHNGVVEGAAVQVLLRPEALRLGPSELAGLVTEVVNEGSLATVVLDVAGGLRVAVPDPGAHDLPAPGDKASVVIPPGAALALPAEPSEQENHG
ncbi:ABC transporter ATP-binding protein [Actinophytocola algeriensis]|uniref:ABC-type Fe3+/spermidine/putrescine transport system ATPase subunit n=1 Tax=Actinophytocola algeriensis TaxID=1768010 RepID=A0A7W7QCC2_9PSEU|nr:ABC transporter ATP-binding protein [Actinophytocola algeriensis]MBB4910511.1 ABC-type Fe3+/spermidine/putrescine transport system ATPase subunit [Actinophytocola algeriensis]MBE1480500.1 ABC-type Fe3+/spermidine/putrescine transport system ATPase subunit [Actinophytocola algeriensis]